MIIHRNTDSLSEIKNAVVTTGIFDGVHAGHAAILKRLSEISQQSNGESVIISFDPHPQKFLSHEDDAVRYLTTIDEKISLLKKTGVDHLILLNFNHKFASLSPEEYVKLFLLDKLSVKTIVAGFNHHFGRRQEGDFAYLNNLSKQYGFAVEEITVQEIENEEVSSAVIIRSIAEGNLMRANSYLGYPYFLFGTIIPNENKDEKFNSYQIKYEDKNKLLPRLGRYAARISQNNKTISCLAEISLISKCEIINIYLPSNEVLFSEEQAKLYFYKKLRFPDADDDGYFYRARLVDQGKLDELIF